MWSSSALCRCLGHDKKSSSIDMDILSPPEAMVFKVAKQCQPFIYTIHEILENVILALAHATNNTL